MGKMLLGLSVLFFAGPPAVIWDASPNYYASNREVSYNIDTIVIHTTEGIDTNGDGYYSECYYQAINWFNNPTSNVSAHYVIAPWGEITQMVKDDDIARHSAYYNNRSIGIECAGFASSSKTWTPQLVASLVELVAYLADKYNVPVVHPTGNAATSGGWYGKAGIVGHDQIQTSGSAAGNAYGYRSDPGSYFPWSSFIQKVKDQDIRAGAATNLKAVPGTNAITFSWNAASGADGYWLDLAKSSSDLQNMTGSFQKHSMGSKTSYTWPNLSPSTYHWRVWSFNAYGGQHAYPGSTVKIIDTTVNTTTNPGTAPPTTTTGSPPPSVTTTTPNVEEEATDEDETTAGASSGACAAIDGKGSFLPLFLLIGIALFRKKRKVIAGS